MRGMRGKGVRKHLIERKAKAATSVLPAGGSTTCSYLYLYKLPSEPSVPYASYSLDELCYTSLLSDPSVKRSLRLLLRDHYSYRFLDSKNILYKEFHFCSIQSNYTIILMHRRS
nr:hypothetical protein [Solanum melongena]WMB96870.1 hypothetical protein [Solanum melongena]WMB97043.1 hypothetical protein [Solanum aethiopicum]